MSKLAVAILGSGNIGTDLCFKILKSPTLELRLLAGIDPESDGLARARELGVVTSTEGLEAILRDDEIRLVIDATSARAHRAAAPRLKQAGKFVIDLTPAAVGPCVVPTVNLASRWDEMNVNLISCAAQATIPIMYAISRITPVSYGEIAAAVASRSAGPGTRRNIDEFTRTTTQALVDIGGAQVAKTIMAINPGDPPIMMRNTVYANVGDECDEAAVIASIEDMVDKVKAYVPGYRVRIEPFFADGFVTVGLEVEGAGDYLPAFAGNLDIITAAAVTVAEQYALSEHSELAIGG
ncbi:acetaldehyde dehydrogenase (acetylating) [Rhodococcus opacus]|uniref:acetaldehyde dehydrogenase (acetylating) n=1 Tax=Rhodococcus opacus TaxID=37919 RepID=UPI0022367DDD|nr:acetaldehyde dehydrogenase (acetylating) [Rhodococcus opacus]UZG60366.1 acetaldehyde dehydrogenase (acetylating) [Rhodococcus opacus]